MKPADSADFHTENIFPSTVSSLPAPFFSLPVYVFISFYHCFHPLNISPSSAFLFHLSHLSPPLSSSSTLPLSLSLSPLPSMAPSSRPEPIASHCNWQLCFSPLLWRWQRGPVPSRRLCYRLSHEADTLGRPSVICCDNSDYFHSLPSDQHIQFN